MDPSGFFSSYSICGIGEKEIEFISYAKKNSIVPGIKYFNYEKTITFTLSLIQHFLKSDLKATDIKITIVSTKNKFQILSLREIDYYLEKLRKINQFNEKKYQENVLITLKN